MAGAAGKRLRMGGVTEIIFKTRRMSKTPIKDLVTKKKGFYRATNDKCKKSAQDTK